jgi:hypothetical protein
VHTAFISPSAKASKLLLIGALAVIGGSLFSTGLLALSAEEADPFADLDQQAIGPVPEPGKVAKTVDWTGKVELFSQFTHAQHAGEDGSLASRQSIGGESYARFSTATATIGAVDVQVRLVRRDHPIAAIDDPDAMAHAGWDVEVHNCYLEFYNVLTPLMARENKSRWIGICNVRLGRYYVPFGINEQTDTHGTVLQLSNDEDFGFERDWGVTLWGSATSQLNYTIAYLLGSGHELTFSGQTGLLAARVSLANRWRREQGLEAGLAVITGERLAGPMYGSDQTIMQTFRIGPDARVSRTVTSGTVAVTGEAAIGTDDDNPVAMILGQADYLYASRRWGAATQYRRYELSGTSPRSSLFAEMTWYFRNDVSGAFLSWLKCNVERKIEGAADTLTTLQYYFYW